MFVSWFSVLSAISIASAVPVSVYPVRPYVFLTPELPKFSLQPSVRVQAPAATVQPVQLTKFDSAASSKQYVLVYPSYQYITTRQDDSSNSGFFETIQNYFINFGQSEESSQMMDQQQQQQQQQEPQQQATQQQQQQAPQQQQQQLAAVATKSFAKVDDASQDKVSPTSNEFKQNFAYSYLTPASTVPLNADRRLFYLAEQPQSLFGTFSGSAINPVFNLQRVPVVLSRSNVAQSDEPQPNKVISENVEKLSQIPPVMAIVEQAPQVEAKSNDNKQIDSIVTNAVIENRISPVEQLLAQTIENNRALPVLTEPTVVPDVSAEVVARSKPVPLAISNEPISTVVAPEVGNVVENESVQPVNLQPIVSPSLKNVQSAEVPLPSAIVPPAIVDQNIQSNQSVESVTGSV